MRAAVNGSVCFLLSSLPMSRATNPTSEDEAISSVHIVSLGDSMTAAAHDWAPKIGQVYSECLPGALSRLSKPRGYRRDSRCPI